MVAGMSSRFGGKIKQFAKVGPNGETLIEVSMDQAINAGFNKIIFVVGDKTETQFKEKFGDSYNGVPVFYTKQFFNPEERDKPWGTTDALVTAKEFINENFVVCNGDDIYGKNALKETHNYLEKNDNGITVGYKLKHIIPEEGAVNRGKFETDTEGNVTSIKEILGISKENFLEKDLTKNSLCSMNLFGLTKETLLDLEKKLVEFKEKNAGDRKAECFLPVELGNLIEEGKLKMKLIETNDKWFGVTNPEDEEKVRNALSSPAQNQEN